MSDYRVLVCRIVQETSNLSNSLQMLRQMLLPNATRLVAVSGKVDAGEDIKTFNFEAGYPSDPAHLQTLAAWAEAPIKSDVRLRDGFELYCLRQILKREEGFDSAILLRAPFSMEVGKGSDLVAPLFHACDESPDPSIMFNLRDRRAAAFFDLAWDLYATGAVYAMAPYGFAEALGEATKALGLLEKLSASHRGIAVDSDQSAV